MVFVYRVPAEPSSTRVSVWRDLKRIGALYLQQCVCVLPERPDLRAALTAVRDKIQRLGGSVNLFDVPRLSEADAAALVAGFRGLVAQQYAEIVEECETKFVKEIEFEHFRQNYTFAEAEEIEQDLDKIRRWFERVQTRDWFDAAARSDVEAWIGRCEVLLTEFFDIVHARTATNAGGPDATAAGTRMPPRAEAPLALPSDSSASSRRRLGDSA
jgi:Asp-tRNA(Asn)/Glu-tRNA(Gln) amidotransferase A subunit family amidase